MKRKNILNKLRLEFEDNMPDNKVLEDVKNTKVTKDLAPVYDAINDNGAMAIKVKQNVMFISGIMFLTMLLFTVLLVCLPILNAVLYPAKVIVTKFGIEINPSIELMLDEDDNVVLCLAKNRHAEVLISGESFIGQHISAVTKRIITLATQAGYFTTVNDEVDVTNAIMLSAISEDETKQRNLLQNIKNQVKNFYINNQIYGVVLTEFASKQELVDLVCALDYNISTEEKEGLINESVKSLNNRLNKSYTTLKRRFKSDFDLEELIKHINPVSQQFQENKAKTQQKLNDSQHKLNNFESDWLAETALCQEKIELWELELNQLKQLLLGIVGEAEKSELEEEIHTKQIFLTSEQEELKNRAVNGAMFNASKHSLANQIESYKRDLKGFNQQYKDQLEKQLSIMKNDLTNLNTLMQKRKEELINSSEGTLQQHLSSLGDYNVFYNDYSNWLNNRAEQLENIRINWDQYKTNWEVSYSNFVKF